MSRFMQTPQTSKKKEVKERVMTTPGNYNSDNLRETKKIPTKGGYK